MNNRRVIAAAVAAFALMLSVASASAAAASGAIQIIDIRPVIGRHNAGNSLGLAYNPDLNVIYLSHGSDIRGGFIYTVDLDGHFLNEIDFWAAYQSQAIPTSLTYDRSTGHLFVLAEVPAGADFVTHLVEISVDGSTSFSDLDLGDASFLTSMIVRDDGLWSTHYSAHAIRHYSRTGALIEEISVADAFPFTEGPFALASSFSGGFFVVDHFGRRLVEVDGVGEEIAEGSTATLPGVIGAGRALAIDSDVDSQRIFIQVENRQIYILPPEFLRAFVNRLVTLKSLKSACSHAPVPGGPAGTCTLKARFTNTSSSHIDVPVFLVTEAAGCAPHEAICLGHDGPLLLNGDGSPGGVGAELTPDVGTDGTLSPGESFTAEFVVGLQSLRQFIFFVDLLAAGVR